MGYNIPILFIFFNRPETALISFEKIKKCKPAKLYLASDGGRENKKGEEQIVINLRETIIGQIDWNCEVKTLFRDRNYGCGPNVFAAINWLFENEEYGIILEDDCIVQDSFFAYMEEMLTIYKDDQRIGMVAGYNSISKHYTSYSYLFSTYKACWGWGTWKRAWKQMDYEMKWRNTPQADDIIFRMGYKGTDKQECLYKLYKIDYKMVSAWDWQWYFSLAANNQLCIFPSINLVSNIGFGKNATHTSKRCKSVCATGDLEFPLKHPICVVCNMKFDKEFHNNLYSIKRIFRNLFIPKWVYKLINRNEIQNNNI